MEKVYVVLQFVLDNWELILGLGTGMYEYFANRVPTEKDYTLLGNLRKLLNFVVVNKRKPATTDTVHPADETTNVVEAKRDRHLFHSVIFILFMSLAVSAMAQSGASPTYTVVRLKSGGLTVTGPVGTGLIKYDSGHFNLRDQIGWFNPRSSGGGTGFLTKNGVTNSFTSTSWRAVGPNTDVFFGTQDYGGFPDSTINTFNVNTKNSIFLRSDLSNVDIYSLTGTAGLHSDGPGGVDIFATNGPASIQGANGVTIDAASVGLSVLSGGADNTFDSRVVFTSNATKPGINWGSFAGNPSSLNNADGWYNASTHQYMGRWNGATIAFANISGVQTITNKTFTIGSNTWSGIFSPTNGGTNNAFTGFTGPTTSIKTFTLPNASATILTDNAPVTAAQGGTSFGSYTTGDLCCYATSSTALAKLAIGTAGKMLQSTGTAPGWGAIVWPTAITSSQLLWATGSNQVGSSGNLAYSSGSLNVANAIFVTANGTILDGITVSRAITFAGNNLTANYLGTGNSTMRGTSGDEAYLNNTNNGITTGAANQIIFSDRFKPTWTINHAGATIRGGVFYDPTVAGSNTATLHTSFAASSGLFVLGSLTPTTGTVMDVQSTVGAFAPPRMTTTQQNAIGSPAAGSLLYNTTTSLVHFYNGSAWGAVGGGTIGGSTGATDNRLLRADGTGGVTVQNSSVGLTDTGDFIGVNTISGATTLVVNAGGNTKFGDASVTTGASGQVGLYGNDVSSAATGVTDVLVEGGDASNGVAAGTIIIHGGDGTGGSANGIVRIEGTRTNDAATAGDVGEEIAGIQSTYTNYTTTATYQNIASITLTAGDWDLSAFGTFYVNGSTVTTGTEIIFVVSTTTASAAGAVEGKNIHYQSTQTPAAINHTSSTISPYRLSISGSTTYYLNTQATFTIGNPQFVGSLRARRIR